jgi:hypothetical protein
MGISFMLQFYIIAGTSCIGYTWPMSDAQTIYEYRLACHKPGCPVCTLIQRAGARYIEGIFNESMLDPGIRQKLVDSNGFCYKHSWLSINLKLSDALGHAILFQDLVKKAINVMMEHYTDSDKQISSALDIVTVCPACRIEEETLERVIDSLAAALRDPDFLVEFNQSDGLCIPHMARLLGRIDGKKRSSVLDHQLAKLELLRSELEEFIRKSDYRFRDEVIGKEGDSYKRAADLTKGKREAAEKKDLK